MQARATQASGRGARLALTGSTPRSSRHQLRLRGRPRAPAAKQATRSRFASTPSWRSTGNHQTSSAGSSQAACCGRWQSRARSRSHQPDRSDAGPAHGSSTQERPHRDRPTRPRSRERRNQRRRRREFRKGQTAEQPVALARTLGCTARPGWFAWHAVAISSTRPGTRTQPAGSRRSPEVGADGPIRGALGPLRCADVRSDSGSSGHSGGHRSRRAVSRARLVCADRCGQPPAAEEF